jgi:hypothetical protein
VQAFNQNIMHYGRGGCDFQLYLRKSSTHHLISFILDARHSELFYLQAGRSSYGGSIILYFVLGLSVTILLSFFLSATSEEQQLLWTQLFSELFMFILGLGLIFRLSYALSVEQRLRGKLLLAYEQLQRHATEIQHYAVQEERSYQVWDVQDSLGQSLVALNLQLQAAIKLWQINPSQAQHFLITAYQQGVATMHKLRQSLRR